MATSKNAETIKSREQLCREESHSERQNKKRTIILNCLEQLKGVLCLFEWVLEYPVVLTWRSESPGA